MPSDLEIFGEVLDAPPSARGAILDRACGSDAARRAGIESLLAAYESAGDFLQGTLLEPPPARPEEKPGDAIGRYTLVRKLGEGGCGTVYLAEQKIPVRRQVALKVIKLGMDTRAVIARFEGERQALALMDHPDIARVLDAGATEAGRPFFVMDFVDGVPIARFCDEHRLTIAARLALFVRVCAALQHAHQKGIIHRDVKPSNILVSLRDGEPAPKVIDFGIAKATQDRLTEHTLVTGVDQFIGTPAYMSPEQADARDGAIDTRTDIYALGIVLYELLAGRLPFDPKSLVRAGPDELRRLIRESVPPRPSQRLAALSAEERAALALHRGCPPAQLVPAVRGDLDWIVLRCLEKDRARRYGTAQELADDIRRHLGSEPVEARPPSQLYRTQRFIARHRFACASAAVLALTLVAATVVSVRQAVVATRATRTAVAAGQAEVVARTDAQRRQKHAEDLLAFLVGDVRADLRKAGQIKLLEPIDKKVSDYFAALNPRDLTDAALAQQAKALYQIGATRLDEAKYAEAAANFTASYERTAALAARHPRNPDMLFERAQAEYWSGFVALRRGELPTVREWFTRYRDSAVALVAIEGQKLRAQRELTYGHHNLAILELDQRHLAAAQNGFLAEKASLEEMLAANPGDSTLRFSLADVALWLGTVAERDGRYAEAIERFAESSSHVEQLVAREPAVARWRLKLADSVAQAADVRLLLGQRAEALAGYERAKVLRDALVAQDPKNRQWLQASLNGRLKPVSSLLADGEVTTAATLLAELRDKLEALVKTEPSSRGFTATLAAAWLLEARLRFAGDRSDTAEAIARAVELGEPFFKEIRADDAMAGALAQSHLLAGRIMFAQAQPDVARDHWNRALKVLTPGITGSNDWRLLDPAAQALVLLGKTDEARPLIERLRGFGYRPIDPLAASILAVAPSPPNPARTH